MNKADLKIQEDLGRTAYNSYCNQVGWKSFKGDKLPDFDQQSDKIKLAWTAAAVAIVNQYVEFK